MSLQKTLWSSMLVGAFAAALACGSLTEALNEEECGGDSDCGGKLSCVANQPSPVMLGGTAPANALGLGWCLEQDSCVVGAQPFCGCGQDPSGLPVCQSPSDSNRMVTATVVCQNPDDPNDCWCVPVDACPFPDP